MNYDMLQLTRKILPRVRLGDTLIAWLEFRRAHGRSPRRDGSLMDAIYYLKTGPEALNPLRSMVVDKAAVKAHVRRKIGEQHNVPTIAVLDSIESISRFDFPPECVIKPTHMSGQVIMRRDGSPIDFSRVAMWLESNYYRWTREHVYKYVPPRIIVEPFIFGSDNVEDFKIFCIHGEPRLIWVDLDRRTTHKRNFYSPEWKRIDAALAHPQGPDVPRPANLDLMLHIARRMSSDFNLIRVDLYSDGESALVGELTNFSGNANDPFFSGERAIAEVLFPDGLERFLDGYLA